MSKLQTLKGFRDFLPKEAKKRQWLTGKIRSLFENWGYEPVESPTLEYAELFKGQIGEDEKLFFKFTDQGDREVAMRYDQTVPTCRIVAQYRNELKMPFKRYQIQTSFRAERPQKGRYREFLQADADIFGVKSPVADAECIALSLEVYRQIGFSNVKVLINDRSLLKNLPYEAIVAIDKLKKIGKDGVIEDMVKKGIDKNKAQEYLNYIETIKPNETMSIILSYLKNMGFKEDWYIFDPTIARSFAYSSGPIWEVVVPEYTAGSVLGGERYDNLIKSIAGVEIPATGFAVGFDRTLEAAEQLGLVPELGNSTQILVSIFNEELLGDSIQTLKKLKSYNLNVEMYPGLDKLGKQFKYADDKKIPYVLVIGPEEKAKGEVKVKNMNTGEESTLKTLAEIKNIL